MAWLGQRVNSAFYWSFASLVFLDYSIVIESAKRQRSQLIMKNKPITTEIIRNILDVHNKKYSNVKGLRRVMHIRFRLEFLRCDDLCSIFLKYMSLHNDQYKDLLALKQDWYIQGKELPVINLEKRNYSTRVISELIREITTNENQILSVIDSYLTHLYSSKIDVCEEKISIDVE